MKPSEYEQIVADLFRDLGYDVKLTPQSNDFGVDVFATKGQERIAIQAKMYGKSRPINRDMVFSLHGTKDYFDCTKAVIVTDGELTTSAIKVAQKLGIEIRALVPKTSSLHITTTGTPKSTSEFERIWEYFIVPLEGSVLRNSKGDNIIKKVDWAGVRRITSTGKHGFMGIEIFRWAVNQILEKGSITRIEIHQEFHRKCSAGVFLVLSQVPEFETSFNPQTIRLRRSR